MSELYVGHFDAREKKPWNLIGIVMGMIAGFVVGILLGWI